MKASPLQWIFSLLALVASLWGLGMLQSARAEDLAEPFFTQSAGDHDDPGKVLVRYLDSADRKHFFFCHIDPDWIKRERDGFGYPVNEEEDLKELDLRLKRALLTRTGALGLGPYARIMVKSTPIAAPSHTIPWFPKVAVTWAVQPPPRLSQRVADLRANLKDTKWMKERQKEVLQGYLQPKGFALRDVSGDKPRFDFAIDYKGIADRATPKLADCFNKLVREAPLGSNEEVFRSLMLLLQAIPLDLTRMPPEEKDGLVKDGFWVPSQILLGGQADCDSNATTFSALWPKPHPEILLLAVEIPEEIKSGFPPEARHITHHALLGIEAEPIGKQKHVEVGNRKFVLIEVATQRGSTARPVGATHLPGLPNPVFGICMTDHCFEGL